MVTTVDRGRFTIAMHKGPQIYAIKARELGRKGIVVGDNVRVVGNVSGDSDTQARIVARLPRTTTLRRTADDADPVERVIVANATQLGIVTATADPEPRIGLIDRALVAAYDAGLTAVLIITKPDIAPPDHLLETYADVDITRVVVHRDRPQSDLSELLSDEITVLVGHSGVGKSTLVNALTGAERRTGFVNAVTGRGRHTSTNATAFPLIDGGWLIDTPGIRSFGLAHVDVDRVVAAFPDLTELIQDCPRACSHNEPDCALNAVDPTDLSTVRRIESLRRLLTNKDAALD